MLAINTLNMDQHVLIKNQSFHLSKNPDSRLTNIFIDALFAGIDRYVSSYSD
jgi:hypothetical protein